MLYEAPPQNMALVACKLRTEAYIDVKEGFVDSGASPDETKPIETANKVDKAKQLRKKKKFLLF